MFSKTGIPIPVKVQGIAWLVCGLLVLLNAVLVFWCLSGQETRLKALETEYQEKRRLLAAGRSSAPDPWLATDQDLTLFQQSLPPARESSKRFEELKGLLADHQLTVDNLTFQSQEWEPLPLVKFTTGFTVSGSYSQLKRFLADLQKSPSLFCIDELAFHNRSTGDSERIDLKLSLSTYFQPR